jgi:8-amino-7-oxononanoate synthase
MNALERKLKIILEERESREEFRSLNTTQHLIDFSSNDYLGLSANKNLIYKIDALWQARSNKSLGSGGSRLLRGNDESAERVESELAKFYKAESTLLFNSGYQANVGLLSTISDKNDTIIYDEFVHASIRDGIRLSNSRNYSFRHENLESLERKLSSANGTVFVVVEALYSMDGDLSNLLEIVNLCKEKGAHLIVDEAHSSGVYGEYGEGLSAELGIEKDLFARVHTFGKALGCHGAVVAGSNVLRDYLINYSRPFIYTTAMPFHSLLNISEAHRYLMENQGEKKKLFANIKRFKNEIQTGSNSAIQPVIVGDALKAKELSNYMKENNIDLRAIMHPTVSKGEERLRVCLHSFNSTEEIDLLTTLLKEKV